MSGRPGRAVATRSRRTRTRTTRRLLAVVLLALVATAVGVPGAHAADNALVVSEPGDRQQLDRPPGFVTLAFEEPVDPSLAKLLVQDANGVNVTVGELIVEGTNMASQLADALPQGTYTVTYRLARSDGEPQGGTFQFSYGPGTFGAPASTWSGAEEEPAVLKNPDPNAVTPDPRQPQPSPTGGGGAPSAPSTASPTASVPPPPGADPTDPTDPSGPTSTTTPGATGTSVDPTPTPVGQARGRTWVGLAVALLALGVAGTVAAAYRRRRAARRGA